MLFYLGLFVIFFLGSLKISLPYLPSRLQSKKIKQLLEMGNIDKILRSMQYMAMYSVGNHKVSWRQVCDPFQILMGIEWLSFYKEAQRLRILIRNVRKIIRFIRGPQLTINLWKKLKRPKKSASAFKILSLQRLTNLQTLTKILGQACLLIFYLTDHHQTFYEFGLLSSEQVIAESIGDFGIEMRMWFSIFLAISISANFLKTCLQPRDHKTKKTELKKLLKTAAVEFIAHIADILLFYGILHKGFLSKKYLSFYGFLASTLRLTRVL